MRAVNLNRAGARVHWLADDDAYTLCGIRIRALLEHVVLELEHLPGDGCPACDEAVRLRPRGTRLTARHERAAARPHLHDRTAFAWAALELADAHVRAAEYLERLARGFDVPEGDS